MDVFNFSVSTGEGPIESPGEFVYFQAITTGSSDSRIEVKTSAGDRLLLKAGQGQRVAPFKWLRVKRESGSATIAGELAVGAGDFTDNRLNGSVSVAELSGTTLALPGNVTVGLTEVQALAAATRRKVVFTADSGNTGDVALGPTGLATTTAPIVLGPGDSYIADIDASAEWFARATVAAQALRVMTVAA